MLYYKIIPLEKLKTEKFPAFTYSSEKDLPLYSLVKINLKNRPISGIIWRKTQKPLFTTKKIQALLEPSFLGENQFSLAKKISNYYFYPLNETLKLFFPPQIRTKNFKEPPVNLEKKLDQSLTKKIIATSSQKKIIKEILNSKKKNFLIFGPASSGKTLIGWEIAKKVLTEKKQILVILPEIFLAYQEVDRWKEKLNLKKDEIFFIHSTVKKTTYREKWEKIKTGKIKLIIGSRSGLFLPFLNLGLIVLDEEQDPSHRQWDKPPFYHAKEICFNLTKIFSAKLLLFSATPTPESFLNKNLQILNLPRLKTRYWEIKKPQLVLADLRKSFFERKKSSLSPELKIALKKTLLKKELAFIFVPQRGFGRKIICSDCRKPLSCPNCKTKLADLGENYRCLKCGYQKSSFLACPNCHSFRLKSVGIGTEKIAREIQTLFPSKKILIADKTFFQKNSLREKTWKMLKKQKADILIGTQVITKGFDLPFLSLVIVLEAENYAGENNFRFDEKKMSTLFQLAGRVNRPQSTQKGIFLLQTFYPEDPKWNFLKNMDWQDWLEKEIENRKALAYPPFSFLTKLTYSNKKNFLVEKTVKKMYTVLNQEDLKNDILSVFSFPEKPFQKFSFWKKNILLKTSKPPSKIESLKILLKKASFKENWTIEIDPENIF